MSICQKRVGVRRPELFENGISKMGATEISRSITKQTHPERTRQSRSGRFHRAKAEAICIFSKGPKLVSAFNASRKVHPHKRPGRPRGQVRRRCLRYGARIAPPEKARRSERETLRPVGGDSAFFTGKPWVPTLIFPKVPSFATSFSAPQLPLLPHLLGARRQRLRKAFQTPPRKLLENKQLTPGYRWRTLAACSVGTSRQFRQSMISPMLGAIGLRACATSDSQAKKKPG